MFELNNLSSLPIAVFDSGIGGLTIEKEIRKQLPNESIIYVADHQFAPYGDLSEVQIIERVNSITTSLVTKGIKALVIACNTATAIAIDQLRNKFPALLIIGVEPAIKPAIQITKNNAVGVLTTPATALNKRFINLVNRFKEGKQVIIQPCPGLVEIIEQDSIATTKGIELLKALIEPLLEKNIDTVVLGCTHYPYAIPLINQHWPELTIVETSKPVAMELCNQLKRNGLLADKSACENNAYFSTGTPTDNLKNFTEFTM